MKQLLSIKNDFKPLLKLALPLACTGIIQALVPFFETIFLARLGQQALAAGAIVIWSFATIVVILFGTLSSVNVLIAHKHGANDTDGIARVLRDGLVLATILAILAFILLWHATSLFLFFGQNHAVVKLATSYMHALAHCVLPDFLMIALLELLIGLGHTRVIMLFTIITVPISLLCTYGLIFGKFGLPALGIAGAGWGLTLSYYLSFFGLAIYILSKKIYRQYFLFKAFFSTPTHLWELMQIGVPMGAMFAFEVGFFLVMALLMGTIDSQSLSANQITMQYMCSLMSVVFTIAQAITVRMGHELGAGNLLTAQRAGYTGVCLSGIFMLVAALIYYLFLQPLIAIDLDLHDPKNDTVIQYATQFLAISAVFQIPEAIRISLFGALRGLKETSFSLITSILSFWGLAMPLGYLLATRLQFGGAGLWWGMVTGASFSMVLLFWRFNFKMKYYLKQHELKLLKTQP